MAIDLFAGIPVNDFGAARVWYERLFGAAPDFFPHETEAVWGLDERRWVYVVQRPDRAGNALVTVMFDDLDALADRVAQIGARGIDPTREEAPEGNTRKVVYHDPDGNEIGFGGISASASS